MDIVSEAVLIILTFSCELTAKLRTMQFNQRDRVEGFLFAPLAATLTHV